MEEVKRALMVLCGMSLFRCVLSTLLPQGAIKRFAQYGFSFVQISVLMDLLVQMVQLIGGVWS